MKIAILFALVLSIFNTSCKSESSEPRSPKLKIEKMDLQTGNYNDSIHFVSEPLFQIQAETPSYPLFSFDLSTNGEIRLIWFIQHDLPVDSLSEANGDVRKLLKMKYKKQQTTSRLTLAELEMAKKILSNNSYLFETNVLGQEGGTGFGIKYFGGKNGLVACLWGEPLPTNQAKLIYQFYNLAFSKFEGEAPKILHEGVLDVTPSLQAQTEN